MEKKFYYILGFLLIVGVIIFAIDFDYELTGKEIFQPAALPSYEWPMFGLDEQRSSWDNSTLGNIPEIIMGAKYLGGEIVSSPSIIGPYIYVGSTNGTFYQLDRLNIQSIVSSYSTGGPIISSLAGFSGIFVYVGSEDGKLYQFDANNVSQLMASYNVGSPIVASPVGSPLSGEDVSVYIGSEDGIFYQFDASNVSQLISSFDTGSSINSSAVVSPPYVYVGNEEGILYQLNWSNVSQKIGEYSTGSPIFSSPLISRGSIYFGSYGNQVYQLDSNNVSRLIGNYSTDGAILSSPAIFGMSLYIASSEGTVYELDAGNISQTDMSFPSVSLMGSDFIPEETFFSSPAVGHVSSLDLDVLYVGGKSGALHCYNIFREIQYLFNFSTGGSIRSSPALTENFVYFGSDDGKIYQLPHVVNPWEFSVLEFVSFLNNSPIMEGEDAFFGALIENYTGKVYLEIDNHNFSVSEMDSLGYLIINLTLAPGDYNYRWIAKDYFDDFHYSETMNFVVQGVEEPIEKEEKVEEVVSGGSVGSITTEVGEISMEESSENKLKPGQKINFSIDGLDYEMSLDHIYRTDQTAEFSFDSLDESVLVKVGEIKDIDLNNDLVDEVSLELLEISDYTTEVDFVLKRKTQITRDISDAGDRIKGVSTVEPVIDGEEIESKSFETFGSVLFGWFEDLFNSNRKKCGALEGYTWSRGLDFCINEVDVLPTEDNKKVLNFLKKENNFGDYFVIIEDIRKYDCEGCYVIDVEIDGEFGQYYLQNWQYTDEICVPSTCSELGYNCGFVSNGCGVDIYCGECQFGYDCVEGNCVLGEGETCVDSDGGENYYQSGSSSDLLNSNMDYCEGSVLYEAVCSGGYSSYVAYDCPEGCSNGSCLEPWCQDDDPEENVFIFGTLQTDSDLVFEDYCSSSNSLTQYFCNYETRQPQIITTNCIFGCQEGKCIKGECYDSDLQNYRTKGYVEDNTGIYEDYCGNTVTLYEAICVNASLDQGQEYDYESVLCEGGCINGTCPSYPEEMTCIDYGGGIDYYDRGILSHWTEYYGGSMFNITDGCANTSESIGHDSGIYAVDYFCRNNYASNYPYYGASLYECPEGCLGGKCIAPENETSYCDGEGTCKLYLEDYLVFDDYLAISAENIFTNEHLILDFDYEGNYPEKADLIFFLGNGFETRANELIENHTFDYDFSGEGFFWMEIEVLNIFSNRDSETVYENVATPYVEFSYNIPDYKSNTKKIRPQVRADDQPVLKNSVTYEKPTVFTKIGRGIKSFLEMGAVEPQETVSKTTKGKSSSDNFMLPMAVH